MAEGKFYRSTVGISTENQSIYLSLVAGADFGRNFRSCLLSTTSSPVLSAQPTVITGTDSIQRGTSSDNSRIFLWDVTADLGLLEVCFSDFEVTA